jgi:dolichol-phosphate mannosyltransferase
MNTIQSIDIVIPVYNEGPFIESFHTHLVSQLTPLGIPFKIIYVNDGSKDDTQEHLLKLVSADILVQVIELSRNFGHQAALSCGLEASTADLVITMDGDGEHPPEKIPEMISLAQQGYDQVLTQRDEAQTASKFKQWTSDGFYRLLTMITSTPIQEGVGDFRLMSRPVVDALNSMPEVHRFLRGMVAWVGFKTVILPYSPAKRIGGSSKYTFRKMVTLAINAIYSFSLAPLTAVTIAGILFLIAALIVGIIGIIQAASDPTWQPLLVFLILFCTGAVLTSMGSIGLYASLTFQQVKQRPVYIIRSNTKE